MKIVEVTLQVEVEDETPIEDVKDAIQVALDQPIHLAREGLVFDWAQAITMKQL